MNKRYKIEMHKEVLRTTCTEVDIGNDTELTRIAELLEDAFEYHGKKMQGLAAIQLGEKICASLLRYNKNERPIIVFNQKILFSFGSKKSYEGCLSEGSQRYIVKRPVLALVSYYTVDGMFKIEFLPYRKARIFIHEFDHTKGVLLQDKGEVVI